MKKIIKCLLIFAALFFTLASLAQNAANKTTSQLNSLLQLKGYWEARGATLQTNNKQYTFTYYTDFKTTADNNGLVMNEWGNIPGIGKLNGTNLIGINPYDGKVHWYSVDNMGTTHEHIGEFADNKHFSMVHKGIRDGKEYIETITLTLTGADKLDFILTATLDSKEEEKITGTFQRKTM